MGCFGERVTCPKCGSESARYEKDRQDVWLRCLCGLMKLVDTTLESAIRIEHVDSDDEITLPRQGSKLHVCFAALMGLREASTGEIADHLNFAKKPRERLTNSDVASQLTVLKYKGLVKVLEEHKGVAGGSIWGLTDAALRRFNRGNN